MPTITIRVRLPKSSAPKELTLDPEAPWIGVLYELEAMSDIPVSKLRVLSGFPPKPVEAADTATIAELKLRNNDTLIVQEGEARVQLGNTGQRYVPPAPEKAHFTRRICPADNSCMFHACAYILRNRSRTDGPQLREECVQAVLSRPDVFNAALLGQPPLAYAAWLQRKDAWGGAIELMILSNLYETEIIALDLESSRMERFGESKGYSVRGFVVYTGNHYDCIAMNPMFNSPYEKDDQVLFNTRDGQVVERAKRFVREEGEKMRKGKTGALSQ